MFRALTCPSSGGKFVFTQHLVSSLSINVLFFDILGLYLSFLCWHKLVLSALLCMFCCTRLLRCSCTILFLCSYAGKPVLLVQITIYMCTSLRDLTVTLSLLQFCFRLHCRKDFSFKLSLYFRSFF